MASLAQWQSGSLVMNRSAIRSCQGAAFARREKGVSERVVSFVGEVAKRSNALGSGPSPSGSRVRFSPSSLLACIAQWQSGALVMLRSGIQSSVQAVDFLTL